MLTTKAVFRLIRFVGFILIWLFLWRIVFRLPFTFAQCQLLLHFISFIFINVLLDSFLFKSFVSLLDTIISRSYVRLLIQILFILFKSLFWFWFWLTILIIGTRTWDVIFLHKFFQCSSLISRSFNRNLSLGEINQKRWTFNILS